MSLTIGQQLGPYIIESAIGAGGMGEVYKAKDTRLDRIVALKILLERMAHDKDLRARFEREAKIVSSLNHPNICTLYDVGFENGTSFFVMEYLEGETLSERLKRTSLSTEDVLNYAIQIGTALSAAHERGLIHRDLKPGNVILTREGAKLLDFGLAKITVQGGAVQSLTAMTQSTPLTGTGAIMGTLNYMSPEQLEGGEADARSDIFAFGALLYEMITGNRPFEGKSQASLIAAIIEREPRSISEIKPLTPPALDRVVKKCLLKDPHYRWQSARDLTDELRWISQSGSQAGIPFSVSSKRRFQFRMSNIVAALGIITAVVFTSLYFFQPKEEVEVTRFTLSMPEFESIGSPKLSPDGKMLSFLGSDSSGSRSIWVRPLNALQAYKLPGTEIAERPFWSPDSRSIGFFSQEGFKKILVSGGPAQKVVQVRGGDGSWGTNGVVIFDASTFDSIQMLPAAGGAVIGATKINRAQGEKFHAWPTFLPDGNHFFYIAFIDTGAAASRANMLKLGAVDGTADKSFFDVGSRVEFTSSGHVIFIRDGVLVMQKFDEDVLEFVGDATAITDNIAVEELVGLFSVSQNGTLAYQQGSGNSKSNLIWFDRGGKELSRIGGSDYYGDVDLSFDDQKLVYGVYERGDDFDVSIWVHDIPRNISSKLTFSGGNEFHPAWSFDNESIFYTSDAGGSGQIFSLRSDGSGDPRSILASGESFCTAAEASRDGKFLLFNKWTDQWNIFILNLEDTSKIQEISTNKEFQERRGSFTPNGRFVAYQSDESGTSQIYIRNSSGTSGKWQVSTSEGFAPKFRADGKELYYVTPEWDFMAVPVSIDGDKITIGAPQKLFNRRYNTKGIGLMYRYDVSRDGQRFIINVPDGNQQEATFVITLNWEKDLSR